MRGRRLDIGALREARFAEGLWCVHCESRQVQRWGYAHGRQRYRCKACRRTFSDLTRTPLAYSKRAELWGEYARRMLEGISVREAAKWLGINKDTAFRWRHRILAVLECATHPAPQGIVELHETYFPYSEKGRRIPGRMPRRRGIPPGHQYQDDRSPVCVVVGCDRAGGATSGIAGRGRARTAVLRKRLLPALGRPCMLVSTAGRYSAYGIACARTDVVYHQAERHHSGTRKGAFLLDSTARAEARVVRLHVWLRRFRGVATRYLDNYLRWHLAVDEEPTGLMGPAGGWPLVGLGRIRRR
ncbi:MAG TPA: IS1595 family transposase [Longimicrobiales bacterium]